MLTLLQISDLHVGSAYLPSVAQALVKQVPKLKPDVIIVSGDFTQRAKRHQFEEARRLLDQLPRVPTVVVPGNHDVPLYRIVERLLSPHGLYKQFISEQLDSVLRLDDAVIVALDSTSPYGAITNGRITRKQLDFCCEAFRDTPSGATRIVVAHHPFAPPPDYDRSSPVRGAKRAMNRLSELGVDLIFGGHLHRAYIGNSLDVFPDRARRHGIIIVQCGTTTSRRGRVRERERNSFNVINLSENMFRITHYMDFDGSDEFAPLSQHVFPRNGGTLDENEPRANSRQRR